MRIPLSLDRPIPGLLRSIGIQVLCDTFARTFDVTAPRVAGMPAPRALRAFREFSAACIEEALASPSYAAARRADLEARARALGAWVRTALKPADTELAALVRALYAAIEIDVFQDASGCYVFRRCSFAPRYSPAVCAFMSAFDSGFVGGLCAAGRLEFKSRLTEGAPCCRARLAAAGVPAGFAEGGEAR